MGFGARVFRNTSIVVPKNFLQLISFNEVIQDDGGYWNPAVPTELAIPAGQGGMYVIEASVSWQWAPGSNRALELVVKYGPTGNWYAIASANLRAVDQTGIGTHQTISMVNLLNPGAAIGLRVFQNATGDVTLESVRERSPILSLTRGVT